MVNIKPHSANGRNWLFVQVPNILTPILCEDVAIIEMWSPHVQLIEEVELPPGNYRVHCIAEEATEEQAEEVVDHIGKDIHKQDVYDDYSNSSPFSDGGFRFPQNSLASLTRSLFPDTYQDHKHVILEICTSN